MELVMGWGPGAVYGLCLVTSALCAALLMRSYGRSRQPLLLWSAACFSLLAVPREEQSPFYLLRLLAFLIIIVAIIGKSRRRA